MKPVLAHRGFSSQYPENTLLAFQKAIEVGADGVEFDVQLTKDGVPVIIHDEDLRRVAGEDKNVRDLTLKELQAIDVSYRYKGQVARQSVPTLESYFDLIAGRRFLTNIELKTAYFEYPGIEEKVIAMIRARKLEEQIILSSFNHYTLLRCKAIAPELPCGILYGDRLADPQDYAVRLGMEYLHPLYLFLNDAEMEKYEAAGIRCNPWTVDREEDMRYFLRQTNIRCLITNRPDVLLRVRNEEFGV